MSDAGRTYTAFDLLPEATVVVDSADTILHVNDRARSLLGLGTDAVGSSIVDVVEVLDESREPCPSGLAPPRTDTARLAEALVRVVLPDDRTRPLVRAGRFLDDGVVVLTFRHAGRRELADRKRSDLVATVSHEIRSPLTSVKGFTRTLLMKWDRFNDEQKKTMLETINLDADRVTRLLGELLEVSRIDAGRVQMHRRMVAVDDVVAMVVEKVAHRPEGSEREIVTDLPAELPEIYADPDKVEQVITNLVENALKYCPESQIRITGEVREDEVQFSVADDGPGIPDGQRTYVFTKFGRVPGSRAQGTGLGLYITKGLVTAHHGRVWVDSVVGEGSTFHVVFPRGGIELARF